MRRTTPISHVHGYDRGKPVDRHYIEQFLRLHASDINGHVLEIKDPNYTQKFGGERVSRSDVLDVDQSNDRATIIADLNAAPELPSDTFDCIIFTQTLQYVYRRDSALRDLHRSLRRGGVLLMTVPGITLACNREPWHWSFTPLAVRRLMEENFPGTDLDIRTYGNLLTATAFLYGLSAEDLQPNELAHEDPEYPLIVAARAVKGSP